MLNLFALLTCLIAGIILQRQDKVPRFFTGFLFFMAGANFSVVLTQLLK